MARSETRRRWRSGIAACACVYPAALLALSLAFYWIGEGWWLTAAGLYLPRFVFGLPLPFFVLTLWATGRPQLLWTQIVAAALLLFPLMGGVLPSPTSPSPNRAQLRVLSFNVDSALGGVPTIMRSISAEAPDIALLQETGGSWPLREALREHYPFVQSASQFLVASRYRIASSTEPDRLAFFGRLRSARFMRYSIDTPLGALAVYNVHPISPRGALGVHQFRTALRELRKSGLLTGDAEGDIRTNMALRALQIEAAARAGKRERQPVLIAGDTNLPGLSKVLRRNLSGFTDGFPAADWGFGYSYPSRYPFLRLDRILASDELRFVSFRVACQGASDHLCVVAEIQALR